MFSQLISVSCDVVIIYTSLSLHIFNMLWAQRRTNGWIFAEMVIAVCALWILADQMWVDVRCYQAPMGYDISNTWRFKLSALPAETSGEA